MIKGALIRIEGRIYKINIKEKIEWIDNREIKENSMIKGIKEIKGIREIKETQGIRETKENKENKRINDCRLKAMTGLACRIREIIEGIVYKDPLSDIQIFS